MQDETPFTIMPEEARAWVTHLSRHAPYFTVVPTDEWITPARVRAIHAECERVAALAVAVASAAPDASEEVGEDW